MGIIKISFFFIIAAVPLIGALPQPEEKCDLICMLIKESPKELRREDLEKASHDGRLLELVDCDVFCAMAKTSEKDRADVTEKLHQVARSGQLAEFLSRKNQITPRHRNSYVERL